MLPIPIITILLVITLVPINTYALSSSENRELSRLLLELKALDRIIAIAEGSTDKHERFQFDYQQLRQDLLNIQQGIEEHIKAIRRDPRVLPEIKGDYW